MKKTYQTPQSESIEIESAVMAASNPGDEVESVYNQPSGGEQMSKRKAPWNNSLWEEE